MAPRDGWALAISSALLWAPAARADRPRARPMALVYTRGPGAASCPDASAVHRAVEQDLGYDPFDRGSARRLRVSIDRRDGDLVVEMDLHDEAGDRVWEDRSIRTRADCGTLVSALGLAIALRVEPEPSPPACPGPPRPAPPRPEPSTPPDPRGAPPPFVTAPGRPVPFVTAGLAVAWLSPSAFAPGAILSGGARWSRASIALEARVLVPGAGDTQGSTIRTWSFAGTIVPCAHFGPARGCGLIEADAVHLGGADAPPTDATFAALASGVRAGASWPLAPRVLLGAHVDLLGRIAPSPSWVLSLRHGALWYAPEVRALAAVDVTFLFPPSPPRSTRLRSTSSTKETKP